jgi:hypothetical protein
MEPPALTLPDVAADARIPDRSCRFDCREMSREMSSTLRDTARP